MSDSLELCSRERLRHLLEIEKAFAQVGGAIAREAKLREALCLIADNNMDASTVAGEILNAVYKREGEEWKPR